MDAYSVNARLHMKKYGTTWEQIAGVAAKNHHHSTMNPLAQFQKDMSLDEMHEGPRDFLAADPAHVRAR